MLWWQTMLMSIAPTIVIGFLSPILTILLRSDKRAVKLGLIKLKYESTLQLLRDLCCDTCQLYMTLSDFDNQDIDAVKKTICGLPLGIL